MTAFERWLLHVSTLVVVLSGTAYGWMKFLLVSDDPFSVVNHPWQGSMLALHVIASPALMLGFGMVLSSHAGRKLSARAPNCRSGLAALVVFALTAASGYLLQVVTAPGLARTCLVVHLGGGAAFAAVYVTHMVIGLRMAARAPEPGLCSRAAA